MPHSHHSHSGQFCAHAKGTLEQVVLVAIERGFTLYGLSEHVPRDDPDHLYPEEIELGLTPADLHLRFEAYLNEAHRLKKEHLERIALLVGLETEWVGSEKDPEAVDVLLRKYGERIEYVVGSVHHVKGVPIDFDRATFDKAVAQFSEGGQNEATGGMSSFLCAYFDAQYELLQRVHPEIVGHIDLCRLYNPKLRIGDYPSAWEKVTRNVKFAVEYGAMFELNAAALRKGWDGCYPGEDVLQLILGFGGRFALSDDSHGPDAVGQNYALMFEYLRRTGVAEIWYLERSDQTNVGGRYVRPARLEGEWWNHPFWKALKG